jgi:hypothetical protein
MVRCENGLKRRAPQAILYISSSGLVCRGFCLKTVISMIVIGDAVSPLRKWQSVLSDAFIS